MHLDIVYEGLSYVCFHCGIVRHQENSCVQKGRSLALDKEITLIDEPIVGENSDKNHEMDKETAYLRLSEQG